MIEKIKNLLSRNNNLVVFKFEEYLKDGIQCGDLETKDDISIRILDFLAIQGYTFETEKEMDEALDYIFRYIWSTFPSIYIPFELNNSEKLDLKIVDAEERNLNAINKIKNLPNLNGKLINLKNALSKGYTSRGSIRNCEQNINNTVFNYLFSEKENIGFFLRKKAYHGIFLLNKDDDIIFNMDYVLFLLKKYYNIKENLIEPEIPFEDSPIKIENSKKRFTKQHKKTVEFLVKGCFNSETIVEIETLMLEFLNKLTSATNGNYSFSKTIIPTRHEKRERDELFMLLPRKFSIQQARDTAKKFEINEKLVQYYLTIWIKNGNIKRVCLGQYEKLLRLPE